MGELTAGSHDLRAAALADGGGEMLVPEYALELFDTSGRRGFECSPGVLVKGDEIDLGAKTSEKLGQLSSCFWRVIHTPEEKILEGDPVAPRQVQLAAGI